MYIYIFIYISIAVYIYTQQQLQQNSHTHTHTYTMTSLLSIQYVTSLPEVVHSEKELFKLRNILPQKRTIQPPLNNNRVAYVDALVGK